MTVLESYFGSLLQWAGARHPDGWSHLQLSHLATQSGQPAWEGSQPKGKQTRITGSSCDDTVGVPWIKPCLKLTRYSFGLVFCSRHFELGVLSPTIEKVLTITDLLRARRWDEVTLGVGIKRADNREFKNNNRTHYESGCFLLLPFIGNFKPY